MALFSALQKFITKDGRPVEGASVIVKLAGSATPATLYATRDGGVKSNPFLTDAAGNALCYVSPGRYDMTVTFSAEQVTFNDVEVGPVSSIGSFAAGGVVTDPDQLVEDAAGNKWRWAGPLNYTFAPGEDPELVVGWVKWADAPGLALQLEQSLAAEGSLKLIGGTPAGDIGERLNTTDWVTPTARTAAAINAAFASGRYVMLSGEYTIDEPIVIPKLFLTIFSMGAKFNVTNPAITAVVANNKRYFQWYGRTEIVGQGVASGTGIEFTDCTIYEMYGFEVRGFLYSIICDGEIVQSGGLGGVRGRQGKWDNISCAVNGWGPRVLGRAEYTLWNNLNSSQNTIYGFLNEAGNTRVSNSNICDNQNGVFLGSDSTSNDNHGGFDNCNINHNLGFNLRAVDVEEGMPFSNCSFYGDGPAIGSIDIIRCSGISISGGIINAAINLDGTDATPSTDANGYNKISNVQINKDYTVINDSNGGRAKLIVEGCWHRDGLKWSENDIALVAVRAEKAAAQSITSNTNTTVIFDTEIVDNRGVYNNSTGVLTVVEPGWYDVAASIQATITGGTYVDGFVTVFVAGVSRGIFPISATSTALTSVSGAVNTSVLCVAGNTITIVVNIEATAGTISLLASQNNRLSVSLRN